MTWRRLILQHGQGFLEWLDETNAQVSALTTLTNHLEKFLIACLSTSKDCLDFWSANLPQKVRLENYHYRDFERSPEINFPERITWPDHWCPFPSSKKRTGFVFVCSGKVNGLDNRCPTILASFVLFLLKVGSTLEKT
jgi:hypothetical protein